MYKPFPKSTQPFQNLTLLVLNGDQMNLRPSSNVVLLPCRIKLQFGSTVARQEINSDSHVAPESNQIRVYWRLVIIFLVNPRGNAISPKHINIIYELSLARQKHDVWIAVVPESCSRAELVELNCLPKLIQNFDSDVVLLPCFCRA